MRLVYVNDVILYEKVLMNLAQRHLSHLFWLFTALFNAKVRNNTLNVGLDFLRIVSELIGVPKPPLEKCHIVQLSALLNIESK